MATLKPVKIVIAGIDKFSSKFEKQFKTINKAAQKTNAIGRKMSMGLTLPIVGAGIAITRTAVGFESSMNKVEALTQASTKQMGMMRVQAKKLGLETKFSATEAAEGMSFLGMAGFEVNEIMSTIPALLDLAAASQIDLGRAADITSNIMAQFNMDATQSGKVADILAATTASANVDMEMLFDTMKMVGPIAHKFGVSLEDAAAATGFFGNMGIQGTLSGTAFRTMLINLASPAAAGAKALESIGIKVAGNNGKIKDFKTLLGELAGKISKLSQVKQIQVLNDIFGKRAISASGGILDNIARGEKGFLQLSKSLQNVDGWAARMSQTMNKGAVGAIARFVAGLEGLAIRIGESGFLDALTSVLSTVTKVLGVFAKLPKSIMKTLIIVAGLVAALGPLLIMASSAVTLFTSLAGVIATAGGVMAVLSSPIAIAVAGIAAVVLNLGLFIAAARNLDTVFGKVVASIVAVINPLLIIPMYIISRWEKLSPFFSAIGGKLKSIFFEDLKSTPLGTGISWMVDMFSFLVDKVLEFTDSMVFGALGGIMTTLFDTSELQSMGFNTLGQTITDDQGASMDKMRSGLRNVGGEDNVTRVIFDNLPGSAQIVKESGNPQIELDKGPLLTGYSF